MDRFEVVVTRLAAEQIEEAARYIARDKEGAAATWAEGVLEAAETLSEFPRRGRVVPEVGRTEVREIQYGTYRIVYRIAEASVFILTVLHGRRRLHPDGMK